MVVTRGGANLVQIADGVITRGYGRKGFGNDGGGPENRDVTTRGANASESATRGVFP